MSRIKLKESSEIFKEYKNLSAGGPIQYKDNFLNISNHARNLSDQMKLNKIEVENNKIIITLTYDEIPSKTNRIQFRKKIINFKNIPQIDMTTYFNESVSKITYLITNDEYKTFCDSLKEIIELTNLKKEKFENQNNEIKKLIKQINKIKEIQNNKNPNKIEGYKHIKILPIFSPKKLIDIFEKLKINFEKMDWNTYILLIKPEDYKTLSLNYNFLIGEIHQEQSFSIDLLNNESINEEIILNEPNKNIVVGVIDSGIDLPSIFDKYIEYEDRRELKNKSDKTHGSSVTSLIIANDKLNHGNGDTFGQFKVKHFELLEIVDESGKAKVNTNYLYHEIKNIVSENKNIKIWNLSFGSVKKPFSINISQLGKLLDILSMKYDCLFIVASGNNGLLGFKSISSPADSLNSLSVGSVGFNDKNEIIKNEYSSWGPVTHFVKPEISHFGGPYNKNLSSIKMFGPLLQSGSQGTSFSAPKITRYAAKLISEGLTPQQAKANIIASATRETLKNKSSGFGWINFEDVHSLDGEIILINNKPHYMDINIPDGVESISISSSALTTNSPIFGEEYNLMNVGINIIGYKEDLDQPEKEKKGKISVKENPQQTQYKIEQYKRYEDGKYFTSKKKDYKNSEINLVINKGYKIALRIRKLNLYNIENEENLKVAFCIKMFGNVSKEEIIQKNKSIVEIDIDTEIST